MICLSVVSHGQAPIAAGFLSSLASVKPPLVTRVVYTRNIPEPALAIPDLDPIRFEIIDNAAPHGFGENHNAAFRRCAEPYFCVVNPDILLVEDPFPALVDAFREPALGLAAPLVLSPERQVENADIFGFTLTDDEVRAISGLERGRLWGGDPDTHEEM